MFCPTCGVEQRGQDRYCRGCGAELRTVRLALERPDAITSAAVGARDEIGRAIAVRINEIENDKDLRHVVEDLLPAVSKFLESPEQSRLRQIREGVITSAVGLGIAGFGLALMVAVKSSDADTWGMILVGVAALVFLIGLGIIAGGFFFTIPRKKLPAMPAQVGGAAVIPPIHTSPTLDTGIAPPSVTEATTYDLKPIDPSDRTTGPR